MVKFSAPSTTQGPLAGYTVRGRWVLIQQEPDWRGDVGYETYEHAVHWVPAGGAVDHADALNQALNAWIDFREPDSVTVDAVYQSSLSGPAGSDHDPFTGLEGTGHDGYDPSGKSKQRGKVGE